MRGCPMDFTKKKCITIITHYIIACFPIETSYHH